MRIAGYRIERELGRGATATVYLAIQESLERPVALKVLDPTQADTAEFSRRFLAEGRIIAALRHQGIIAVHDLGVVDGLHYIITEYLDGGDLRVRMATGLTVDKSLALVRQVAEALGAAHRAGVVHRDVKPANILFRADGTPVLADFGVAKRLDAEQDMTLTGTVLGSPSYLSPEQATGRPVDGRSDLYSLGIILFELLTGRKPFRGQSAVDTMLLHLTEPVPTLPEGLRRYQPLVERTLAKDPADRFPSAEALVDSIDSLERPVPTARAPSPPSPAPRERADHAPPAAAAGPPAPPLTAWAHGLPRRLQALGQPGALPRRHALVALALTLGAVTVLGLSRTPQPAEPPMENGPQAVAPPTERAPQVAASPAGAVALAAASPAGVEPPVMPSAADPGPRAGTPTTGSTDPTRASDPPAAAVAGVAAPAPVGAGPQTTPPEVPTSAQPPETSAPTVSATAPQAHSPPPQAEPSVPALPGTLEPASPPPGAARPGAARQVTYQRADPGRDLAGGAEPADSAPRGPTDSGTDTPELERYLTLAREAISQSRLTTPAERSAYGYLQRARRLAPDDPRIATGLREIARRYATLARASIERSEHAQANQYIDRGLMVSPGDPQLLALRQEATPPSAKPTPPPAKPLHVRVFDRVRSLF